MSVTDFSTFRISSWVSRFQTPGRSEVATTLATLGTAVGVLFLSTFATVGNMLAFPELAPRRGVQLALLIGSLLLYASMAPLVERLTLIRAQLRKKRFWLSYGILLVPVAVAVLWGLVYRTSPSGPVARFLPVVAVCGWLFLLCLFVSVTAELLPSMKQLFRVSEPESPKRAFFWILVLLGICLAVKGWWYGPPPGEAYVAFGGSVIVTALCGAIGVFCLLFLFRQSIALFASLPYLYIVLFSTSRTGHMLLFSLLILFALVKIARRPRPPIRAIAAGLSGFFLPILLVLLVLFLPIHFESRWYPFHATQESEDIVVLRIEELYNRMSRSLRALSAVGIDVDEITIEVMKLLRGASNLLPNVDNEVATHRKQMIEAHFQHMLKIKGSSDDRWTLVKSSWELMKRHPVGMWPVAFETQIGVMCSKDAWCDYPHNILLDAGYQFGWLPALFLFVGFACVTLLILWQLSVSSSLVLTVTAACLLNHLLAIQVTGTFTDWFPAFLLILIWLMELGRLVPRIDVAPQLKAT